MRPLSGAVAILFLATVPLKVSATVYVSNLGDVWQGGGIGDIESLSPGGTYAGSVSTGAGAFHLNFVSLEFFDSTPQVWNNVVVQLYQQVGFQVNLVGNLGNPLADPTATQWPQSSASSNGGSYTTYVDFSPIAPITLASSSTSPAANYYVTVSGPPNGPSGGVAALMFTLPGSTYTTPTDWLMGQSFTGTFDGTTVSGVPFGGGSSYPLKFAVDATLIPEPGAACVIIFGLGVFAIDKKRRVSWEIWVILNATSANVNTREFCTKTRCRNVAGYEIDC